MPEGPEAGVSNGTQNGVSKFWTFRTVGQLLGRSWETIEKLHMPSVISEEPKDVDLNVAAEGDSEQTAALVDGPNSSPVSLIAPHLAWRRQALLLQEGLHVAAVHIASLLGCEESGWENFDFEALEEQVQFTLHGLLQGLEACNLRLERLYVDFDCLDDGAAEGLFGSEGMLKEELQEIQEVQGDCAALQKRSNGWLRCSDRATGHVMGLEALADFLEEAVPEMDRLVSCFGDFAARRRAAVARAKAAIETADAEERASAVGLLQEALSPSSRVDFPRITEICQRVADRPDEAEQSAAMLWAALSSEVNSIEGHEAPRRQLKALTIAHELLYDDRVLLAFTEQDTTPLKGLESSRPGTLGRAAEEAMRMLAAEVRRRVEEAREKRGTRSHLFFKRHTTWSFTLRRGDGKSPGSSPSGPTQPRLRSSKSMPLEVQCSVLSGAKLEVFLRKLRRWGSWYRFDGEELQLLESLRENFRELLNALARLREELDCLDDGSSSMPLSAAVEEMAPWLLLASQVQATASGWCQALASAEASREQGIRLEAAVDSEKLADFVEEALTAETSLEREVQRFQQLRHQAVARAKAFIEAGPLLDFEPEDEVAEGMRLLDDAPLESLESQK